MGGGPDVADAFKQQIQWAGGGDFLVLRTSGDDAYNSWIYDLAPVNSVATLLLNNRDASYDPFVVDTIKRAEAIWFAGGDQASYITWWESSPLQSALLERKQVGIPFGGTSAGCAILGQWVYSALNDTVTSAEALANPYDFRVTLSPAFLPFSSMDNFITDPHFVTRDRMGRLVDFVARLLQDKNGTSVYGIGVDEQTALVVNAQGFGQMLGNGTAYIIHSQQGPEECEPRKPLTYKGLSAVRLSAEAKDGYNFLTHTARGGTPYALSATKGRLSSKPYGP